MNHYSIQQNLEKPLKLRIIMLHYKTRKSLKHDINQ
ncbi:unnamed protein product [Tenebrio molitor]|nr:unnamed protein product [Tenebrio molitor]